MNRVHQTSFISSTTPAQHAQKMSKRLILGALTISLIAIPIIYSLLQSPGPHHKNISSDLKNISTTTSEQNIVFCKKFVEGVTNIGGVSCQNISQLAENHGVFGQRCLKDKLFQDCMNVQKMGVTNDELADHLEKIRLTGHFSSPISYNPSLQANSTIGHHSQTQSLQYGDDISANNCIPIGWNIFNDEVKACRNPPIKNLHNNIHIRITGEIIERVREGLYDGFDPIDVVALLTGHSVDSIKKTIGSVTQKDDINKVLSSIVVVPKSSY